MKPNIRRARIEQVLLEYDGPEILLLKSDRNRHTFGVAIERKDDLRQPFFACEVGDAPYNKYFAGKADLRYVFNEAVGKKYYFFDLDTVKNNDVELRLATKEETECPAYWPQVGFFSRSHTSKFNRTSTTSTLVQKFTIDGKWGASDFSHFHSKMSDLYALFAVLNRFDGALAPMERDFMSNAIQERFWQGGGSYGGFYDDLLSRNRKTNLNPLEVAKIQYASPGQLALRGDADALSYTSDAIAVFEDNPDELLKAYNEIHNALRKAKLLRARPNAPFPSPAIEKWVLDKTLALANAMKLQKVDDILAACGGKTLVFAKVILSIHRRAKELYMFHAEGRVQRLG